MNDPKNPPQEFDPVNNAENFDSDTYLDMMAMWHEFRSEVILDDDEEL